MSANRTLTEITQNLVLDKVFQDKLSQAEERNDPSNTTDNNQQTKFPEESCHHPRDAPDDEIYRIREQRMQELRNRKQRDQQFLSMGHGKYIDVTEEEFSKMVVKSKLTICHFYSKEFARCTIIDAHLEKLAAEHLETQFLKLNAAKAPFFSSKLGIRVLPTIICFVDGIIKHTIVGFNQLGGSDNFSTAKLRKLLLSYGAIERRGVYDYEEDDSDNNSEDY